MENRPEYEFGERLICREYTKIHDVFNVHFQYDIVKIVLEGKLLLNNTTVRVEYLKQF